MRDADSLVPVEVKSGRAAAKSLMTLIRSGHYPDIRYGIKFGDYNVGYKDGVYTFPYFCVFCLKVFLKERVR